jgi:multidrug resistance efflux pump
MSQTIEPRTFKFILCSRTTTESGLSGSESLKPERKGVACPGLLLCLAAAAWLSSCRESASENTGMATVTKGTFEVTVTGKGDLRPLKEQPIYAQTWGTIAFMWEHGQPVKAGEVVVRLDDTESRENLERNRLDVAARKARCVKTEQSEAKRLRAAERTVKNAETTLGAKVTELEELLTLPDPDKLQNARNSVASCERVLELRTKELDVMRQLHSSGAVAISDVQGAEERYERARISLETARAALRKVEAGPTAEEKRQAELSVKLEELNLESARKQHKAIESSCETNIENARRWVIQGEESIKRDEDRLKRYTERAPIDGVALHAPGRWGLPWQPGRETWRGSKIMSIPDLTRMKAVVNISETEISEIRPGQKSRIRVPAVPDTVFTGEVSKIIELAKDEFEDMDRYSQEKLGRAERRVFTVEISINEADERLKPGYNAAAEVVVAENRDALIVPLAAIGVDSTGNAYVETTAGSKPGKVPVEVVGANSVKAQVKGDLSEGQSVRLITEPDSLFRVKGQGEEDGSSNTVEGSGSGGGEAGGSGRGQSGPPVLGPGPGRPPFPGEWPRRGGRE